MEDVKLVIKKEYFNNSSYIDSSNCPITQALYSAGYPELRDFGIHIASTTDHRKSVLALESMSDYTKLYTYVQDCYSGVKTPKDSYEVTLKLNI